MYAVQLPEDDMPLLAVRPTKQTSDGEGGDTVDDFVQQSLPGGQKIENAQQVGISIMILLHVMFT